MIPRECYSFDDIGLVPRYSDLTTRSEGNIGVFPYLLPIICSPMDFQTPELLDCLINNGVMITVHRYFNSVEEQLKFYDDNRACYAIGSIKKYREWIDNLISHGVTRFLVDMAHGDSKLCVDTVKYIKSQEYVRRKSSVPFAIMAGNVCTKSGFSRLQEAGANYIRVGIGSGSICSTRLNTGFGVPLLTSVEDCASVKNDDVILVADGGIRYPGDITKSIAVGADMVMVGRMFAATDLSAGECYDYRKEIIVPDNLISWESVMYKEYHGMASKEARHGIMNYNSVEGVSGLIPYIGTTEELLKDLELNLKASLSYAGARDWKEFKRKVKIIKMSNSSILESGTDVI